MRRLEWRMWLRMARQVAAGARVAGVLDDYVFLGHAALDAWEADGGDAVLRGGARRLRRARWRGSTIRWACGFFDTEAPAEGERGWERWWRGGSRCRIRLLRRGIRWRRRC